MNSRPIRWAESSHVLHGAIRLLIVVVEGKTLNFAEKMSNSPPVSLLSVSTTVQLEFHEIEVDPPYRHVEWASSLHSPIDSLIAQLQGKMFRTLRLSNWPHYHLHRPPLRSETLWMDGFRPFRCAESTYDPCLTMRPLFLVLQGKTFKIPSAFQQLSSWPLITT